MPFTAKISVEFMSGTDTYRVELGIPGAAPSDAAPFIFSVTQQVDGEAGPALLELAVGGGTTNDPSVHLEVSPPPGLLAGEIKGVALRVDNGDQPYNGGRFGAPPS